MYIISNHTCAFTGKKGRTSDHWGKLCLQNMTEIEKMPLRITHPFPRLSTQLGMIFGGAGVQKISCEDIIYSL